MGLKTTAVFLCVSVVWSLCRGNLCGEDSVIVIEEGHWASLTCLIQDAHTTVVDWWLQKPGRVNKTMLGSCSFHDSDSPCITYSNDLQLDMEGSGPFPISTLTIKRNLRSAVAGTVECMGYRCCGENGGAQYVRTRSQRCQVTVIYPVAQIRQCRLQWRAEDGTVSGFCQLDTVYPHDRQYKCWWRRTVSKKKVWEDGMETVAGTTQPSPVQCSFSGCPMHPTTLTPSVFTLFVDRGGGWLLVKEIVVEKPGKPELHYCPTHVTEGSNLTCLCRPSSTTPGTPRPVLTWVPGLDHSELHISDVQREADGETYTCYQYWGGWKSGSVQSVAYTVHVYYPPDVPHFLHTKEGTLTVPANQTITLYCRARGGNPGIREADALHISCEGAGSSSERAAVLTGETWEATFVLTARLPAHSSVSCTCSVATSTPEGDRFHQETTVKVVVMENASTIIDKPKKTKGNDDDKNDSSPPIVIIASGTAGGLLLIVIIVVVIVRVTRRKESEKSNSRVADDRENDFEEHINDMYESADDLPTQSCPRPPATLPPALPDAQQASSSSSRDGMTAVDLDQETSFGYSAVSISQPNPAMSRGRPAANQIDAAGLYSTVDENDGEFVLRTSENEPRSGNEYAVVNKPRKHASPNCHPVPKPEMTLDSADRSTGVTRLPRDVYAQVQKKSKGSNPVISRARLADGEGFHEQLWETKPAVVSSKADGVERGPTYENVTASDQGRPLMEVTSAAVLDDEYKALDFHRGPPMTSSTHPDAQYSHIGPLAKRS